MNALLATQSAVAAGLAWVVAKDVVGNDQPFFAPIAAVVVLSASAGLRLRRAAEMVLGVALGIAIGDALIYLIGVGPAQIAAVVGLAILTVVFLGGGSVAMGQAAASAVLVATLAPPTGGIYVSRFVDALIGGAVGICVMALLLPFNPLTVVRRAATPALDALAEALDATAQALAERDKEKAAASLVTLRTSEDQIGALLESLSLGREAATLAPMRWHSRPALDQYVTASTHIARARRHIRVLVARAVTLLEDGEAVSDDLIASLRRLAEAIRSLRRELGGERPVHSAQPPIAAVRVAASAYDEGVGFSGSVIVAQVNSAATELLRAAGVEYDEADRAVRRAATVP